MITRFYHQNQEWHWNGFSGFFFQPVSPRRRRERVVREGDALYSHLRESSNYL